MFDIYVMRLMFALCVALNTQVAYYYIKLIVNYIQLILDRLDILYKTGSEKIRKKYIKKLILETLKLLKCHWKDYYK